MLVHLARIRIGRVQSELGSLFNLAFYLFFYFAQELFVGCFKTDQFCR